jgi:hypothetical protein
MTMSPNIFIESMTSEQRLALEQLREQWQDIKDVFCHGWEWFVEDCKKHQKAIECVGSDHHDVDKSTILGARERAFMKGRVLQSASHVDPKDVEYEPNPVIYSHLRKDNMYAKRKTDERKHVWTVSAEALPSRAYDEELEFFSPGFRDNNKDEGQRILPRDIDSFSMCINNGPAMRAYELPSWPCSYCSEIFKKRFELKYVPRHAFFALVHVSRHYIPMCS